MDDIWHCDYFSCEIFFVFNRRKALITVCNHLRENKLCVNFIYWVNDPFKVCLSVLFWFSLFLCPPVCLSHKTSW